MIKAASIAILSLPGKFSMPFPVHESFDNIDTVIHAIKINMTKDKKLDTTLGLFINSKDIAM